MSEVCTRLLSPILVTFPPPGMSLLECFRISVSRFTAFDMLKELVTHFLFFVLTVFLFVFALAGVIEGPGLPRPSPRVSTVYQLDKVGTVFENLVVCHSGTILAT